MYKNEAAFYKRNYNNDEKEDPLDPTKALGLLGSNGDWLIIAVQVLDLPYPSITNKLKKFGVEFSIRDIEYLFKHDTERLALLMSPQLSAWEANAIMAIAKSKLKSTTQSGSLLMIQKQSIFLQLMAQMVSITL